MKRQVEPKEIIDGKTAQAYAKFSKWRKGTYAVVAADISERIGKHFNGNILEVGSGPGFLAIELGRIYPKSQITGIDASGELTRIAKQNAKKTIVRFKHVNAYKLPSRANSFDLVVCQGTLHHFYHPLRALQEMLRVLKSGGHLYIQDLRRDVSPAKIKKRTKKMKDAYQIQREMASIRASFTKKELKQFMKKLQIKKFKFSPAAFSGQTLKKNKKRINGSELDEIYSMKELEYILWVQKTK